MSLVAADGTRLSATWTGGGAADAGVLLLPGFWRRAASPRMHDLAREFARRFPVLTLDFRGHGLSRGRFTFGRSEHLDVEAALAEMARRGVRRVVLVGLSMGGAAAIVTLGRRAELPVEVAGLVTVAAPSHFRRIVPRPWRGHRDIPWRDALAVPRPEWAFPFTGKLAPAEHAGALPAIPIRFLHARHDWLVDHAHAERLHAAAGPAAELAIIEAHGAHADELLGRPRAALLRLLVPFVAACLVPRSPAPTGLGESLDPGPWLRDLDRLIADRSRHAADLEGHVVAGRASGARAFSTRDGAHLAFRVGEDACWARGLRDGSTHGLNLLGNQILTDGPAWPEALRAALREAAQHLGWPAATETAYAVELRGERGLLVRPARGPLVRPARGPLVRPARGPLVRPEGRDR